MIIVTGTGGILRVVTAQAVSTITVQSSYVDNNAGTITPGSNNVNITTATTTTVVAAPGASIQRAVQSLAITNNNTTTSCQVTIQHFDGTTSTDIMGVTLLPGENIIYEDGNGWTHHDAQGGDYGYSPVVNYTYAVTGYKAESIPRNLAGVNIAGVTSGTLVMQAIWLPAGLVVNNLITMSGTTASATQTNRWLALYDNNRNLLRQGPNAGATVIAANTIWSDAITAYTTTYAGIHYIGIMTAATTVNTLIGVTAASNAAIRNQVPILTGTSTTALTTTAPNPAAAITATVNSYWVAVS